MKASRTASPGASIAECYAGLVLDLDGVCYRAAEPIPGVAGALEAIRDRGVAVTFATNNASKTPAAVAHQLRDLGVPATGDDVVTSSVATAELVTPGQRCLVIGMDGLREPLRDRGAVLVDDHRTADVVAVGMDRGLTWSDLRRATLALRRGARFLGTNPDATFPEPEGQVPGNGATLAALTTASGRQPEIVGKPRPTLFEAARARLPDGPVMMVGDRLDTDVVGAAALGWDTALVLSGVTTADEASLADPPPTYVLDDVGGLLAPAPPEAPV
ncbi:HAD-IIA family hydrolase [Egibacter rhizosphaerae]|uniref:HAD-IIA family hydrolase n=1 Tax=Egibacter rhizosphaerae TaxID=1670831 RepID=A0A411YBL2_9ACTN|nr:HAD-IIA family hydrolase [Egibacter rhizosphaerae]QBI18643.1 HAD-IIA family hydrolase [Egibacter rhizosphaerae]